jgi:5-methylcytosine-specific restriction protein A
VVRGYCAECAAKHSPKAKYEAQRLSACKRGYGRKWQAASAGFLARHPFCADIYKVHGIRVEMATLTDHIVPHKGDMVLFWDRKNWQPLCASCHGIKTAKEDGGGWRSPG